MNRLHIWMVQYVQKHKYNSPTFDFIVEIEIQMITYYLDGSIGSETQIFRD